MIDHINRLFMRHHLFVCCFFFWSNDLNDVFRCIVDIISSLILITIIAMIRFNDFDILIKIKQTYKIKEMVRTFKALNIVWNKELNELNTPKG